MRPELGHDHPEARGFKFLGSVTVYAFMQSVGLVNDHARFCFRYKELRKNDGITKRVRA